MEDNHIIFLQEIIDDLLDVKKSVYGPLMKLNYFARLTHNTPLLEFTSNELNGYKDPDKYDLIPKYRQTPISIYVELQSGYSSQGFHQIPISLISKQYSDFLKTTFIIESVSTLEKIDKEINEAKIDYLTKKFDLQMIKVFQEAARKIYKGYGPISVVHSEARFNKFIYSEILNIVRQKLLSFTIDVGDKFGYNISINTYKTNQIENNEKIFQIMNTNIINNGNGNVVNTGANAVLDITMSIEKGDLNKLQETLKAVGVEESDMYEILEIVQKDQPNFDTKTFGENTSKWIGKMTSLALSGVSKLPLEVITGVVVEGIKKYFGF